MADTWTPPAEPPVVSDVEVAFGTMDHLPPWDVIPAGFRAQRGPWVAQVDRWFALGADRAWWDRLVAKPGVDKVHAGRCLKALLGCWAPKHEHKVAGIAYLLSLWFDDPALAAAPEAR